MGQTRRQGALHCAPAATIRTLTIGKSAESFAPADRQDPNRRAPAHRQDPNRRARATVKTRIVARSGLASALLLGVAVADAQPDTEAEQESPADGERDEEGGQRCVDPLRDQLIVKLLPALTAPPANGGMCAARNLPAMHPPTGVPGKGPWSTTAEETEPFGANVMVT